MGAFQAEVGGDQEFAPRLGAQHRAVVSDTQADTEPRGSSCRALGRAGPCQAADAADDLSFGEGHGQDGTIRGKTATSGYEKEKPVVD